MNVIIVHNRYQNRGGEDQVVEAEAHLLLSKGHEVRLLYRSNDDVVSMSLLGLLGTTMWSRSTYRELDGMIADTRPDIVHVHNTLPLVSPSIYYAAGAADIPVVQTLHNYRLACPSATLYRNGGVCEDCVGRFLPWPAILHACYRNDFAASAAVSGMLSFHRIIGTWSRRVDRYIALTEFAKRKINESGIPSETIAVKPNFLYDDPGAGTAIGDYALFVGRLSPEKGIGTLLSAWRSLDRRLRLVIVGDGPESSQVETAAKNDDRISWLGWRSRDEVFALMRESQFLVFPSEWYEGFPMTIVEAFASGVPVVCPRLGSLAEIVNHGKTGLLYEPGSVEDLCLVLTTAIDGRSRLVAMRSESRSEYLKFYTAERNYQKMMQIYQEAIASLSSGRS